MMSSFYQQYFENQKKMFDEWQKYMKSTYSKNADTEIPLFNSSEFYAKMMDAPNNFWKKTEEGYKSYSAVFDLWKSLNEKNSVLDKDSAMQIYDAWLKQSFSLIRSNIAPNVPEYLKDFTERFVGQMESSSEKMSEYAKNWSDNADALHKAYMDSFAGGPQGFLEFLDVWQKNYDETFGKMMNAPTFGKDMDFWRLQKASLDRFIKYNVAAIKFYTSLFEIAQDATKQVLEDYVTMSAEGTQPKTFDEFYKYWSKMVSAAYEKVLFSENLSVLSGNMVDAMSRFKIEYDKLCEMYLASAPVPKNSDMDDVYKTMYELKKEVRALKKEMQGHEKHNS